MTHYDSQKIIHAHFHYNSVVYYSENATMHWLIINLINKYPSNVIFQFELLRNFAELKKALKRNRKSKHKHLKIKISQIKVN